MVFRRVLDPCGQRLFGEGVLRIDESCGDAQQKAAGRVTVFLGEKEPRLLVFRGDDHDHADGVGEKLPELLICLYGHEAVQTAACGVVIVFSGGVLKIVDLQKSGFKHGFCTIFGDHGFFHGLLLLL